MIKRPLPTSGWFQGWRGRRIVYEFKLLSAEATGRRAEDATKKYCTVGGNPKKGERLEECGFSMQQFRQTKTSNKMDFAGFWARRDWICDFFANRMRRYVDYYIDNDF